MPYFQPRSSTRSTYYSFRLLMPFKIVAHPEFPLSDQNEKWFCNLYEFLSERMGLLTPPQLLQLTHLKICFSGFFEINAQHIFKVTLGHLTSLSEGPIFLDV